ncbi:hypothetical protein [uncultured Lactobacillus sp.]|uniref:hypothetical protein n=1 Tax=uncultured Lactobacillus sp. TaxID=153152 RepID=UPI00260874DF|nr:hypothetical protein [uncultured Lactobacillus sp.]
MGILFLIGFTILLIYFKIREKNQGEEEELITYPYYNAPVPANIRRKAAVDTFLKVDTVTIEPKVKDKTVNNYLDKNNELVTPDALIVNGNTGEINTPTDQFDVTVFDDNHEVIKPAIDFSSENKEEHNDDSDSWKINNKKEINDLF